LRPSLPGSLTMEEIRRVLAAYRPSSVDDPVLRRAAVLVPLYEEEGEIWLLLTRRTDLVAVHKGQISFPGGAVEPEDTSACEAALRETWEELGIRPEDVEVLGQLDDVTTVVSGFVIRPYVGRIPHPYDLRPAREEIAEVIRAPLGFFLDRRNLRTESRERAGRRELVYFYDYGPHMVWGATARILHRFASILVGERVM
jgi:8-oxo-dGTP pyrophosphatase MutT (NUDIX family)